MSNTGSAAPAPKRRRSRLGATIRALVRTRITAGLVIVLPIWVTYLVVAFVFTIMRDASQWVVYELLRGHLWSGLPEGYRPVFKVWTDAELNHPAMQWAIAIFSVFLTLFLLYMVGLLTANLLGRRLVDLFEYVLDRVPLVKTIYRATKQILGTFAGEQGQSFQRVAIFPFMSERTRTIGFITNSFRDGSSGEEMVTIFCATTPNPTTGFILVCKKSDIVELDWSVEDAVKAIMSGGILLPAAVSLGNTFGPSAAGAGLPGSAGRTKPAGSEA